MTTTTQTTATYILPASIPLVGVTPRLVVGPPQGEWTYVEWETLLPDDGSRYEVINGVVYVNGTPALSGPPQGEWTYAEWEDLLPNDGNRYEIINGVLLVTTAPSYFHQWIIACLMEQIGFPAKQQGLAFAATAPVGLLMPGCAPAQPDFVLVLAANAHIIHDRRIRGVPDLIVEVLSPGNPTDDTVDKLAAYAQAGVPEYAIIDPATRTLHHYRLEQKGRYGKPQIVQEQETITFACLPTLPLHVATLFAGAPDTTL